MDGEMIVNPEAIRRLREARSWSQEHLAEAAGISPRTVQRMETEGRASPESRLAVAAALGIEASTLGARVSAPRPRFDGALWGAVLGFAGATAGVASAWTAVAHGPHTGMEGPSYAALGALYGISCAVVAVVFNRYRQKAD
jgi:transcriptional regulator with XRE-family HTH domain